MAAMMGGKMRAPLTSTLFAVERTGNHLILLPALAASMASMAVTVLLMKRSILTGKIARRGHHLTREYSIDLLAADLPVGAAIDRLLSHAAAHRAFPVTEPDGVVLGLVSLANLLRVHQRVMLAETRRERFFPLPPPHRRDTNGKARAPRRAVRRPALRGAADWRAAPSPA